MDAGQPVRIQKRAGSLLHRTVEAIGRAIVIGDFEVGAVLPVEDDLAIKFGVGRNVIRETVKILSEKGLLRTERRAGTVVLPAGGWNYLDHEVIAWTLENDEAREKIVDELSALRAVVEPEVAALAAHSATSIEILRLFEALESMENAANEAGMVEADILFHKRMFEATHNRLLFSLVRAIAAVLQANFALAIKVKHDLPQYHQEHRQLAEAIRGRDGDTARMIMKELLSNNARHLAEMRRLDQGSDAE